MCVDSCQGTEHIPPGFSLHSEGLCLSQVQPLIKPVTLDKALHLSEPSVLICKGGCNAAPLQLLGDKATHRQEAPRLSWAGSAGSPCCPPLPPPPPRTQLSYL